MTKVVKWYLALISRVKGISSSSDQSMNKIYRDHHRVVQCLLELYWLEHHTPGTVNHVEQAKEQGLEKHDPLSVLLGSTVNQSLFKRLT